MNEWMNEMNECMNERTNERMNEWMNCCGHVGSKWCIRTCKMDKLPQPCAVLGQLKLYQADRSVHSSHPGLSTEGPLLSATSSENCLFSGLFLLWPVPGLRHHPLSASSSLNFCSLCNPPAATPHSNKSGILLKSVIFAPVTMCLATSSCNPAKQERRLVWSQLVQPCIARMHHRIDTVSDLKSPTHKSGAAPDAPVFGHSFVKSSSRRRFARFFRPHLARLGF